MSNTTRPKVWNKRDPNCPKEAIYVGRPTKWGNPFTVAEYGRGKALELYKNWIKSKLPLSPSDVKELKGKDLVCWCKPRPCHADVLLEIINDPSV